jgi:hypothetical protein
MSETKFHSHAEQKVRVHSYIFQFVCFETADENIKGTKYIKYDKDLQGTVGGLCSRAVHF